MTDNNLYRKVYKQKSDNINNTFKMYFYFDNSIFLNDNFYF